MDVSSSLSSSFWIEKYTVILFCLIFITGCAKKEKDLDMIINYSEEKAVSISFVSHDNLEDFTMNLTNNEASILGEFESNNEYVTFIPVIPFSIGQSYDLRCKNEIVSNLVIPIISKSIAPKLLQIYPTTDSVPENLLKMYLKFSKPMQEVTSSLDFITVIDETNGNEVDIFLELENELWNKEHTTLTLWLDPGRIKTDLIPNKEKGLPIVNGMDYTINFSKKWKDAEGLHLEQDIVKKLVVSERNSAMPNPSEWKLELPISEFKSPLKVYFKEYMDAILCTEAIKIYEV